jgi:diaminohydroxyphosphoribosylaminopyrimidine deaminase/5-amino-6-(5-phosphoribosylamino)uracil reductase
VEAGIEIEAGILSDVVERADQAYFHHRRYGRPHITVKMATTLDGQTAALDGSSQWITSSETRQDAHRLRAGMDAVVVGAGTVRADDPLLTVRLPGYEGPQPVAVVVAGAQPLPLDARLWTRPETLVLSATPLALPVETIVVDAGPVGRPSPQSVAAALGERGLLAVLLEGGATLAGSFLAAALVDAGVTYLAAKLAGGAGIPAFQGNWGTLADAVSIEIDSATPVGTDIRIDWTVGFPIQE